MPMSASAMYHVDKLQPAAAATRYDFKTKFQKNPQIDAQIAVRFCAICSIYIMPKPIRRYFDRKYFNRRMRFLFAKLGTSESARIASVYGLRKFMRESEAT